MADARKTNRPLLGIAILLLAAAATTVDAQAPGDLTRIALYAPAGGGKDSTLAAALATVADSVELSLVVMQRYEVRRLPSADPAADMAKVRSYCSANHIDQAILGSGSERPGGGFDFRLLVYDRKTDSITIDKKGSSMGALDMFDTTDTLVASLLQGLSGTHLLFGSLTVDTHPPGATVALNGRDVGAGPVSLRGLPVGPVQITARSAGYEDAAASAAISDGDSASVSLELARSTGTLLVHMPSDGQLTVASAEIGTRQLSGPGSLTLPTGTYQLSAASPGLAAASGQIAVTRNVTVSWLPWTRGYLDVQATPAGSTVTVDGATRGVSPLIVEVDPGSTHHVQVSRDKYQTYQDDVSAEAGDKTLVSAQLTGQPGSIGVTTSIPGVSVRLDDGYAVVTPTVFKGVAAGAHLVTILPYRDGDRALTAGPPIEIDVPAGGETDIDREMKQGTARLVITDAPKGGVVQIEGMDNVDAAKALAPGITVLAGVVRFTLGQAFNPGMQTEQWTGQTYVDPDTTSTWSLSGLVHVVTPRYNQDPRASESDRWAGLVSYWGGDDTTESINFKDQPGTHLAGGYLCRDDKYVYVKYAFSNGTPRSNKLSAEFPQRLAYAATIDTIYRGQPTKINAEVRFQKSLRGVRASSAAFLSVRNGAGRSLDSSLPYRMDQDSLIVQIPLSDIKPYAQGPSQISLSVIDEGTDGAVHRRNTTQPVPVDFNF